MSSGSIRKILDPFSSKQLLRTPNSEPRTGMLTRRLFLRYLLGLPLLSFFPPSISESWADSNILPSKGGNSIGEFFKGEELHYEVGVWLFKRVGLGKLSFRETGEKGRYLATVQGETLGVLGWVARYRVDTYRSVMEEVEGGKRLRSLSFEEDVKVGGKVRRRTHFFDYQKRKWIQVRERKDGTKEWKEEEIPPGMVYDDFITASYNFRYGVYGKIERGKKFVVATFPKKGPSSYEVWVASKEEEEKKRKSEKIKEGKEYFVKLFLGSEVTHSKEGFIEGWLSKELYPVEGMVKDVILFGDVKGRLINKVRS
jgi:Protein of unknown function (DUF3108)